MAEHRTEPIALDAGEMTLHVWTPTATPASAILLIQEIYGIGAHIHGVGRRLSEAGYLVGAPELFWRVAPGWVGEPTAEGTGAAMEQMNKFDQDQAVADLGAAFEHLRSHAESTGRVGVLGFCLGGTLALRVAASFDPAVCVSYYGAGVPSMLDLLDDVECPTLFHFGSTDPYIPGEAIDQVAAATTGRPHLSINVEIAGHAFDNEAPMWHDEAAAKAAWSKTMAFLTQHLPAASPAPAT